MDTQNEKEINTVVTEPAVNTAGSVPPAKHITKNRRSEPAFRSRRKPMPAKSEYDQRILNIRRVARVVAGGRRFSFSVAILLGNRAGKIGVGLGKGADTALAIAKAGHDARKHLVQIPRRADNSIPHQVEAKFKSARVILMPNKGKGLVVGSSARHIFELAGITNVTGKFTTRTRNKLNNARATMKALSMLKGRPLSKRASEVSNDNGKSDSQG